MLYNWVDYSFPPLEAASPEGLLAVGGDLSPDRLLSAYRRGIFPWFSQGQPILWWSPDPRAVLYPTAIRVSRSLRRSLRKSEFSVTTDRVFSKVIARCARNRKDQDGTWITQEMQDAYIALHRLGFAHSVETWQAGELVGGLYGVSIGKAFFGESMFSCVSDASKTALVGLAKVLTHSGYHFIDCQIRSAHLDSLGAQSISRAHFAQALKDAVVIDENPRLWDLKINARELA
ncbi:MAG: leucyl/phenylalanyl-tRNA--protein transferase [Gammaproteobacteria bacterium]|nr:leucyl/phenylalanyl-tRNA--protein transferase [Gammaproteobacteria bacterium]